MDGNDFLKRLDTANNEPEVRERLASGQYKRLAPLAEEWLRRREEARSAAAAARAEARDDESLALARKALADSRLATRIAISAVMLSIVMAIKDVIEWLSS